MAGENAYNPDADLPAAGASEVMLVPAIRAATVAGPTALSAGRAALNRAGTVLSRGANAATVGGAVRNAAGTATSVGTQAAVNGGFDGAIDNLWGKLSGVAKRIVFVVIGIILIGGSLIILSRGSIEAALPGGK